MKKKFSLAVLFLFVSILVIGVTPRTINAEVPSEKNSGDAEAQQTTVRSGDYEYTVITGGVEITGYTGAGGVVAIPEELGNNPVVSIGGGAFYKSSALTGVAIPDGVTNIGDNAFGSCEALTTVTLPESVNHLGANAFSSCRSLSSINLPKSIIDIGEGVFLDCQKLTKIDLPDQLTKIGRLAFFNCNALTAVNFPVSLTGIATDAFSYCNALTSVIIPENVTFIGECAFFSCENLNSIQFNSSKTVVEIGNYFPTIPNSTTIVGYVPSTAKDFADKNGNPFQPLSTEHAKKSVTYTTHVQNYGWQNYADDGDVSGTEGEGLRLEGIKIDSGIDGVGVLYSTHVENLGWQNSVSDGKPSGTSGRGLRLEAITIDLTGENADLYDIYYQVHAQNMGWLGLAKNGESAGTAGYGYRLEGIRILIVPTGSTAPSWPTNKVNPYYENKLPIFQEIINEYRIAAKDICNSELINSMPYVNPAITCKKLLLYYTLIDISGDGNEELIIASEPESNRDRTFTGTIYDIYTIRAGKAERIIDTTGVGKPDGWFINLLADNKLSKTYRNSTALYYKILPDGNLETLFSIYEKDNLIYMSYYEKEALKWKTISAEEYRNLYKNRMNFDWWEPLWK